ncbi:hypothetical protein TWF694_002018 [Orbilia ellipsospora]|uniref:Uncharacterized protein n=1 Tax=Orbilia ellipsospora TaxID=2528407 RepID=A0AAV9X5G1_9PEZI
MKVTFAIASAFLFATAHSLAVIDPARIDACKKPMDDGCAQLCKKCMIPSSPPASVNSCFEKGSFDKLCIPKASTSAASAKYAKIDCDKVATKNASVASQGECKVLCKFAKMDKAADWKEFEEHCKAN